MSKSVAIYHEKVHLRFHQWYQYVHIIQSYFKGLLKVTCEVPQGSLLGPVLFIFLTIVNYSCQASKKIQILVYLQMTHIYKV